MNGSTQIEETRPPDRTSDARRFVSRTRRIAEEYLASGLGPTAAMAEILAALREMDRKNGMEGQRR